MIKRIVKMTFLPGKEDEFLQIFHDIEDKIRSFEGCCHLDLLRNTHQKNIFFTYSCWQSKAVLDQYRNSDLFHSTWSKTKKLFLKNAEAWSTEVISADQRSSD